jgi:hypothetical protein
LYNQPRRWPTVQPILSRPSRFPVFESQHLPNSSHFLSLESPSHFPRCSVRSSLPEPKPFPFLSRLTITSLS